MADVKSLNNQLILREEALRYSIELLFLPIGISLPRLMKSLPAVTLAGHITA